MTKKISLKLIIIFLLLSITKGGLMATPIPPEVKSVVTFIFIEGKDQKLTPNGTGFFVGVKNPSNPDQYTVYMVTAKHVLYKLKSTEFLDKVYVRLNKRKGGSEIGIVPIKPEGTDRNLFTHDDPSVDIAVIPLLPDQEKFDFKFLPDEMVTAKADYENLKIGEGSDVFFTGLFTPFTGAEKNYPVVRFGRVALVTDEKILWDGKLMDLYLIEAGSYGGNSGSPVFFYLGSDRAPGSIILGAPVLKLAGVMQGTFLDTHEIKVIETQKVQISTSSMGIAAVVPGFKLQEILFGKELKKVRGY